MNDPAATRQEYVDLLLGKFATMSESIKQIGQRCDEYGRVSEETRVAQRVEIERLKQWMMNQEWRDGLLRTAMDKVKDLIEAQDEKIEKGNKALRSELESVRRAASSGTLSPTDDNVAQKIHSVENKVAKLSGLGDVESVLEKMSEYMLNENKKNSELREQFDELKRHMEDFETIRTDLFEIQKQNQNEFAHQNKLNVDVISDLNKLGECLKKLCKTQGKENCCSECDEMQRIRECLMNQVLTNRELQIETAARKEEMAIFRQENESHRIKQELYNKSLSLQLKAVRDDVKNVQEFGDEAAAAMSEIRAEMRQIKQQNEVQREENDADKHMMVESFQTEIVTIRQAYSQLGRHLFEELSKLSAGLGTKGDGHKKPQPATEPTNDLYVLSSPGSSLKIQPKPVEDPVTSSESHNLLPDEKLSELKTDPVTPTETLEDTVQKLVAEALLPIREEMSMLYKKVDEMSLELASMKKKQSKKFKGIGRLNAKILSLISSPTKEEDSLLDKSSLTNN